MTLTRLEGKVREPASLTVFVEDGEVKGALNDREEGRVLFRSGSCFLEMVGALEKALQGGRADWRASRRK